MDRPNPSVAIQDEANHVGPILTKQGLADRWQVCTKTVEAIARDRVHGVRSFKVRRQVRFRLRDIEEYELRNVTRLRAF